MRFDGSLMSLAAASLLVSALMHLIVPVLSGFAPGTAILLVFAALYVVVAGGLLQKRRWLAWLTFLWMIVGMSAAIAGAINGPVAWAYAIMAVANIATFLLLFLALWRKKPAPAAA